MNVPSQNQCLLLWKTEGWRWSPFGVKCGQAQTGQVRLKAKTFTAIRSCFYFHAMSWRVDVAEHIFLFDVAVIVCKRRGDNYEMKEVIDLNHFKITNNPTTDKDGRKVSEKHSNRNVVGSEKLHPNIKRSYFSYDPRICYLSYCSILKGL